MRFVSLKLSLLLCMLGWLVLAGCEYQPTVDTPASPASPSLAWESAGRHVVCFTMHNCRQCELDKPNVAQLKAEGVSVITIDADEQPALCAKYGVHSFPHYMVIEDGQIKTESVSIAVIIAFLRAALWIASLFF